MAGSHAINTRSNIIHVQLKKFAYRTVYPMLKHLSICMELDIWPVRPWCFVFAPLVTFFIFHYQVDVIFFHLISGN